MYKYLHIPILCLIFSTNSLAQSISEDFIRMPDEILPYLPETQRKELVELKKMEPDTIASINSAFGKVELTRLTDDILSINLSEHNILEVGRISNDTILVIKTYGAPLQESVCSLYNNVWEHIKTFDLSKVKFEGFDDIIEFPLVSASMTSSPKELLLKLNVPIITKEEKELIKPEVVQRNVKWTDATFN